MLVTTPTTGETGPERPRPLHLGSRSSLTMRVRVRVMMNPPRPSIDGAQGCLMCCRRLKEEKGRNWENPLDAESESPPWMWWWCSSKGKPGCGERRTRAPGDGLAPAAASDPAARRRARRLAAHRVAAVGALCR